jgi:hypothetical protein
MIDPEIQQHVQDALDQREIDNQFQVVPIPSHVHNGTDSQPIDYNNLVNKPTLPITVANGGTGATTLTAHDVLIGNGTGTITQVSPSTSGKVLTSNGTGSDPSFQVIPTQGVQIGSSTNGQFSSNTFDNGNVGSITKNIDWNNGNRQKVTLTGSPTFTFGNPISGATYTLELVQDGTGSRTVTWPSIKWVGGISPLLSTAANSIDIISLFYDGLNFFGTYSLAFA